MAKEETREDEQALPPVETEEDVDNGEEETPEDKEPEQDIDFDKELEALEAQGATEAERPAPKPGKTEEEKAGYTVKQTILRLKNKGKTDEEISKIVGYTVVTEADEPADEPSEEPKDFVTQKDLDLREA